MSTKEKDPKEILIHRDLSWLAFNARVLEEAADPKNPLLEKLKFMAIFVNNMDEFFMVRIAGLKRLIDSGYTRKDNFGWYAQDLRTEIQSQIETVSKRLLELSRSLSKEMQKNNILIKQPEELNADQKKYIKRYFETTIFPIITPMAIDQSHPFPVLPSRTMAYAVSLSRQDTTHFAIIPVPKVIPRLLRLPGEKDEFSFILVEDILRQNIERFFRGYKIIYSMLFRVLRDSELSVTEEYASDLLLAIESEIKKRPQAKAVQVQIDNLCNHELLDKLCEGLEFPKEEVTSIGRDFDFTYFFELIPQVGRPALSYRSFVPAKKEYENIFDKLKEGDMLIHVPYQAFTPTIDLIQSAARDKDVLAIKMTLYRTDENSAIIKALQEAAKNKKQVTVLVEIKARFDEERNIIWVRALEEAGCHVMYGVAGMKIHSKLTLIVRKEEGRIRRYVHLSTGNYNEKTAALYTDLGYFTDNDDFANDISDVFNVITGFSLPSRWKRVVSSPHDLREYFFELIDKEMEYQKKYGNGLIVAKMNALEDPTMIEKLYAASCSGVKIKLIVRGICVLVPGISGLSENIEVKSVVGRFLEHTRVYFFNNNASPRIFLSSADWMSRNFDRRVELLFELYNQEHKDHLQFILEEYWKDILKSWWLQKDRTYIKQKGEEGKPNIQEYLIQWYGG